MPVKAKRLEDQLASIVALDEPLRRALYFHVATHTGEVSRDQAARALRISRPLAAFHLDKLAKAGLLDVTFRRLSDRRGPGAGRPSKLYRRSPRQIDISVPERRYELAGQLMARALAGKGSGAALEVLHRAAREWGERLGAEALARAGSDAGRGRLLTRAIEVLRDAGFEPRRDGRGGVVLQNCPFDALARGSRELVCGMNHILIQGVIAGLQIQGVSARLDPQPGMCCVAIRPDMESQASIHSQASSPPKKDSPR